LLLTIKSFYFFHSFFVPPIQTGLKEACLTQLTDMKALIYILGIGN